MNRLKTAAYLVILLAFGCRPAEKTSEKPIRRDLAEVVYASGNVYTETEYRIFSNVQGYLTELMVEEGDSVSVGTQLAKLSGPNRESETIFSAEALSIAKRNAGVNSPALKQAEERAEAARLRKENDAATLERYRGLYKEGAVSKSELERIQLQAETSAREADAQQAQLEVLKNTTQLELNSAINRFTQNQNLLNDGIITAAIEGKVIELYKKIGDYIHQNEAIGLVGGGKIIARLNVDEADLNRIKNDQKVYIQLDALPGKTIEGKIRKIYPKLSKAEQSFRVDAEFTAPLETSVYGLNLEANIVIRESKNVLCIPRKFVSNSDSVNVRREGGIQKVKISRGAEDLSWVEAVTGILETDELLMP
jgi:HlyD family secretion protein